MTNLYTFRSVVLKSTCVFVVLKHMHSHYVLSLTVKMIDALQRTWKVFILNPFSAWPHHCLIKSFSQIQKIIGQIFTYIILFINYILVISYT